MERYASGQAVINATGGKRKRDSNGDYTALATKYARVSKPKEGGSGYKEYTALAAKPKEGSDDREYTDQAAKSKEVGGDGDYTAKAANPKEVSRDDGVYTAQASYKYKVGGNGREYAVLAAKRKRAAKRNEAYIEFSYVIYGGYYKEVIFCWPTIDEQQAYENYIGLSVILDSDFLGYVDPTLLAL